MSTTELRRYGTGRYVPTIVGDPGPVPHDSDCVCAECAPAKFRRDPAIADRATYMREYMRAVRTGAPRPTRRRGPRPRPETEQDIAPRSECVKQADVLIDFLWQIFEGKYGMRTFTAEERIRWMRANLPRTYAHLAVHFAWAALSA